MDARDIAIRTVIGEAANEGPEGWAGVVHVLRNRAADPRWPDDIGAVALQPQQFSAWNEGAGGNTLTDRYGPGDRIYEDVGRVVDAVFAGEMPDNTGGATHYFSPAGMRALVDDGAQSNLIPRWLQEENARRGGQTTTIGGHIFTGRSAGSTAEIPLSTSVAMGGQGGATSSPAQNGFTQEQIAAAFEQEQPQEQAPQEQEQPLQQIAPMQAAQGYQAPIDGLTAALQQFQQFQQRRKGILG